ncbi:hypothetical protein B296_00055713 [Ensete ventricosum]|uniref:Uncharacterized protein n=1 Tax=Ensete ventricosum TaxID=4639 RepID=A0A426XI85_ENSVE|nr:hypothetical protein B296_00055713 [Ensete ventricosum]
MPRSEVAVGLGRALARKFCSNSLASWSKEKMEAGPSRLYHIRAGPMKVVAKTRYMSASDESYNAIWAQKAATCSVGSELPSYDSKAGNLKLVGIGLSCISGVKGEPRLELLPASSFDFVTSFCTSSNRLFTRRSCTRSKSVEFDDNMSGSYGMCSTSRYEVTDFFGTIKGAFDRVSGGPCVGGPGRTDVECSQGPPWLTGGRKGFGCGGAIVWANWGM